LHPLKQEPALHHRFLISKLEAVARGDIKRLIVTMPPGSAKSTYVSVLFPAWYMLNFPNRNILAASHTSSLADSFSKRVQTMIKDNEDILGYGLLNESVEMWSASNGCTYKSAGVGGGIAGFRADCIVAGTMVTTPLGEVPIEDVLPGTKTGYVLSYDERTNKTVFKRVVAVARRKSANIWRISSAAGKVVEATGNHRFKTANGWTQAASLAVADVLLRAMPSAGREACGGSQEIPRPATLLRQNMLNSHDERGAGDAGSNLRSLWQFVGGNASHAFNLLRSLSSGWGPQGCGHETQAHSGASLSSMRRYVHAEDACGNRGLLQCEMQERQPFGINEGQSKSSLAARERIGSRHDAAMVCCETEDLGARQFEMRGVQFGQKPECASYKYESNGSQIREFSYSLSLMPHQTSRSGAFNSVCDSVAMVERVCGEKDVYDLQIEDTECFFANGLLVHNCAIIDDPVKSRADADSPTYREKAYNWYRADLRTRLKPGASVCLVQCMTGDTPVLMHDGSERPLRDIRVGDNVATYDNGVLSTSKVLNWKNNGPDPVFEIKMTSGKTVRANARHPFLVSVNGQPQWIRTRNLRQGQEIFRANGVSGKASIAPMRAAASRLGCADIARLITIKSVGRMACDRLPLMLKTGARRILNTATELQQKFTTPLLSSKMDYALFAGNLPAKTFAPIGAENCALTIATIPAKCGRFSAMIATLQQAILKRQKPQMRLPPICDFTLDQIQTITPAGVEEVFDVQIANTENFIANGLVSHNTRWHEDDLAGRLLQDDFGDWEVIKIPAIAEENDQLGRAPGEMLWADDSYGYAAEILKIKAESEKGPGQRDWFSLYQQSPRPLEGSIFKTGNIQIIDAVPVGCTFCRAWDLASTAETGGRDPDWTAGPLLGRMPNGGYVIADLKRERGGPDDVERLLTGTASQDGKNVTIRLPQDPGQAGKAQVQYLSRKLAGYKISISRPTGDKATRAAPFASQVNAGNVFMLRGDWNRFLLEELGTFPGGAHDDIVDGLSDAFEIVQVKTSALERAKALLR
jgi:predicted phage terminase large subunit-like protein